MERYTVVRGAGVNTNEYTPTNKASLKKEITFLFIGRIMKEKGVEEFFEAAAYLKQRDSSSRFQVVGFYDEKEYSRHIDELVSQNIIEFLGLSHDTRVEMKNADCIVLPSYHEGMSNVLLEGAAMGLPLITTDIPGCREAVNDGVTGFLCSPESTESLIVALEKFTALSEHDRYQMGHAGREKMINEFDRKIVVNQYIDRIHFALEEAIK